MRNDYDLVGATRKMQNSVSAVSLSYIRRPIS